MKVVMLDASVCYPAPLRDLLMWFARVGLCEPRWSEMVHEEWIRNLLEDRPDLSPGQLAYTKSQMNKAAPMATVTGFEALIPSLNLPDLDDRHVLAAAIHGQAQFLVTHNLRHFPREALAEFGIEPIHPDDFVLNCYEDQPMLVRAALRGQRELMRKSPATQEELMETFRRQRLLRFEARLREMNEVF
jgi:PIN domain